ncbi:MAG: hypothetical protein J4415_02920 [Candidatus Diapherotrites archaeon]|uniref:Uncharacterized protein n=1 Tax=Candidatus Iainarchaeum sp. TaxID=3101447 RepID=A0A8T4KWN9_9ARCH|nr:hypothetical protein [Candidatus Diapherotrites archaeon]
MQSYEALLAFATFLAIIGVFAGALQNAGSGASSSRDYATAKINAEKCAALVNGLYSAGGGNLADVEISCFIKGNKIASKFADEQADAFLIYGNATNVESLGGTKIWVKTNAHYK